jgi:cbb3-type cytochrome oxidase subunit 3
MEWQWAVTTIVAFITFIVGLWATYRTERRARRAAALAAHEQLQRETHLQMQEALVEMFQAATKAVAARIVGDASEMPEFHAAGHRAVLLESRIADEDVRTSVDNAIQSFQVLARVSSRTDVTEPGDAAADAIDETVRKLGAIVREPPSG